MTTNENQSRITEEINSLPNQGWQGSTVEYGIHGFKSLPTDVQNEALAAYVNALEKGWQIPEAEGFAREAASRLSTAQASPQNINQHSHEGFTTFENKPQEDNQQETSSNMPKISKMLILSAGLIAVAYFSIQAFIVQSATLQSAITTRGAIAKELADAVLKASASEKIAKSDARYRDILHAKYEIAYKRESCLIYGSCK